MLKNEDKMLQVLDTRREAILEVESYPWCPNVCAMSDLLAMEAAKAAAAMGPVPLPVEPVTGSAWLMEMPR